MNGGFVATIIAAILSLFGVHSGAHSQAAAVAATQEPTVQQTMPAPPASSTDSTGPATATTTIIEQPVIQRIVENTTQQAPSTALLAQAQPMPLAVNGSLPQPLLGNNILANIASLLANMDAYLASSSQPNIIPQQIAAGGSPNTIAAASNIGQLNNVTIINPSIVGLSAGDVPDLSGKYLSISGGAVMGTTTYTKSVGIGTTSPADLFALNGAAYFANVTVPSNSTNRLYANSGNLYWSGNLLNSGSATSSWSIGNTNSIAGSVMGVENKLEDNNVSTLAQEGGIWSGQSFVFAGISKSISSSTPATSGAPASSLLALLDNNGSSADGVSVLGDAIAQVSSTTVFGSNFIARTASGVNNVKLIGEEIDVEPAAGVTPAAGAGLLINSFQSAIPGPAIQIGTLSNGSFSNGVIVNGIASSGTAFGVQTGTAQMASGLNLTQGSFSTAAAILGNNVNAPTLLVRQTSTSSPTANIF